MAAATATKAKPPLDLNEESTGAPLGKDPKNPGRDSKVSRMGTASIPRLITEFAIPAILGMVVNGAYNVVDSIFLGQAMGEIGLSAATVANPIMIVFMAISMLIGNGGNALAALRLGEGRRVDAEISLGNTVLLSMVVSAIVGIAALNPAILDSLLTLSSATDDVRPYARAFLQIICFGFIFQCIGMGVNNFIRTAGAPNRALVTMLIGLVVSTALNYLFVLRLGWGVEGSALATIIGQAASCAAVLWYFVFTRNVPLKLHFRYMAPHLRVTGTILPRRLAAGGRPGELRDQPPAGAVRRVEPHRRRRCARVHRRGAARGHVHRAAARGRGRGHPAAARLQLRREAHRPRAQDAVVRHRRRHGARRPHVAGGAPVPRVHRGGNITHDGLVDPHRVRAQSAAHAAVRGFRSSVELLQVTGGESPSCCRSRARSCSLVPLLFALPEVLPQRDHCPSSPGSTRCTSPRPWRTSCPSSSPSSSSSWR